MIRPEGTEFQATGTYLNHSSQGSLAITISTALRKHGIDSSSHGDSWQRWYEFSFVFIPNVAFPSPSCEHQPNSMFTLGS